MTSAKPAVSVPTGDVIPPPAFTTKGRRLLVAFIDDDENVEWSGVVLCDSFMVDYDGDGDPEVTVRFELTSEEDPAKSKRRRKYRPTTTPGTKFPPATTGGHISPSTGGYLGGPISFSAPRSMTLSAGDTVTFDACSVTDAGD